MNQSASTHPLAFAPASTTSSILKNSFLTPSTICQTAKKPGILSSPSRSSSQKILHQLITNATAAPPATDRQQTSEWSAETHTLSLYNTITRSKQPFKPLEPGVVRFYSCGPTVYDYAHIGNFRAFLTYDVIKRWLLYRGLSVKHVMNITDVDDKIIKKVRTSNIPAKQLTDTYAKEFFNDMDLVNIIPAEHYPRATRHIDDIVDVISALKTRGHAYERDGSTYFSVSSFGAYGRLAQLEKREAGSLTNANADNVIMDSDEYDKDDLRDFALWKAFKQEDGDVFWNNSLGKGRPGWHIECTCMAMKYLGPKLDIHAGGIDLVFPHHENEIAQSEALTGQPFSTFWLHNGFVNIDNEKMSKRLGNFRTVRDIVKRPEDARAFRYLVVSSQYRSALAFTEQCLKSARSAIKRLDALRNKLQQVDCVAPADDELAIRQVINRATDEFCNAMDDDLNTPRAAAAMFSVVNAAEKLIKSKRMNTNAANAVLHCLDDFDRVFGIFYTPEMPVDEKGESGTSEEDSIPKELLDLLEERAEARKSKDYTRADEIRNIIADAGFSIVDTKDGAKLKRLES